MSSGTVDLNAAVESATVAKDSPKKRTRQKLLPYPAFPDGKKSYTEVVAVDPASQSCPPERLFTDPLVHAKTRLQYAQKLVDYMSGEVSRLDAMSPEARTADRKQKLEKQAAMRALKSDAVKEALAKDASILNTVFSALNAEQIAALQAQLQGLLAAKATE